MDSSGKRRLLLWDIDGTIISSGHAGEAALVTALKKLYGLDLDLSKIDYMGRTDVKLSYYIFQHYGLEITPAKIEEFVRAYLAGLEEELPKRQGRVLPGISEILERASKDSRYVLALLTGNQRRGAELKLVAYGAWHYFPFGAFADDSMERDELGPYALHRAAEYCGEEIPPSRAFVIGDTPHDIRCGKIISAQTIAVATGGFTTEALAAHHPSALFRDFSDVEDFFTTIDRLAV